MSQESVFTLYVRPNLEYCVPAWSPYLLRDIYLMERVQHRATILIRSISDLPYEEWLAILGLQSLFCHSDLIEV